MSINMTRDKGAEGLDVACAAAPKEWIALDTDDVQISVNKANRSCSNQTYLVIFK